MSYRILQFNLGSDRPQGYVLQGEGEHVGTNENISVQEMEANAADGNALAAFLDFRFLRAHGERIAREMGLRPEEPRP